MRHEILQELLAITPHDPLERDHRDDAIAWVRSGAELFRRIKPDTPPKHLVAYVALVDDRHILLVDHRSAQLWLPPGGHVEPGEHPRIAVVRELQEELAMAPAAPVDFPRMVTCTTTVGLTPGHLDVSLWYVVPADRREPITPDVTEFHRAEWFKFDDVPRDRTDPHLGRFLDKLSNRDQR